MDKISGSLRRFSWFVFFITAIVIAGILLRVDTQKVDEFLKKNTARPGRRGICPLVHRRHIFYLGTERRAEDRRRAIIRRYFQYFSYFSFRKRKCLYFF